jgi:hypothetical protein
MGANLRCAAQAGVLAEGGSAQPRPPGSARRRGLGGRTCGEPRKRAYWRKAARRSLAPQGARGGAGWEANLR